MKAQGASFFMASLAEFWENKRSAYNELSRIEKSTELVGDYYLNPLSLIISMQQGTIYLGANDMRYMDVDEMEELKHIIEHCIENSMAKKYDYSAINKKIQQEKEIQNQKFIDERSREKIVDTYVYLAFDNHSGYWKIGYSKNPKSREQGLKLSNPLIEMKHYFNGNRALEKGLHRHYVDKKIAGEWFALTDTDINEILNDTWNG
jgi:hypothetical protein